jgi:hypothetical protein
MVAEQIVTHLKRSNWGFIKGPPLPARAAAQGAGILRLTFGVTFEPIAEILCLTLVRPGHPTFGCAQGDWSGPGPFAFRRAPGPHSWDPKSVAIKHGLLLWLSPVA